MPWNKTDTSLIFECDDCDASVEHKLADLTLPGASEFANAWGMMENLREPWRSFKRIGQPWTFHCAKCGPQAEVEHREHKRREVERDRLKHRNARD